MPPFAFHRSLMRDRRPAFSIIELLVVMGIIAVVAALSIPAMSSALKLSSELACVSNLRSLGQATFAYTADYDRKFPAGRGNSAGFANLAGVEGTGSSSSNIPAEDRLLNPYIDDAHAVAICPLDRGESRFDTPRFADYWGSSYIVVDSLFDRFDLRQTRNGLWGLEGFGLLDVTSPTTKAVMYDVVQARNLDADQRHAWHGVDDGNMRSGMAFVDGHAEVVRLKVLPTTVVQSQRAESFGQIEQRAKQDLYY